MLGRRVVVGPDGSQPFRPKVRDGWRGAQSASTACRALKTKVAPSPLRSHGRKIVLLEFVYTRCPMICTTLGSASKASHQIAEAGLDQPSHGDCEQSARSMRGPEQHPA